MKKVTTDYIIANGGATVDRTGKAVNMVSGYQVSRKDVAVIALDSFTQEDIDAIVKGLTGRGEYAGFWIDNGKVYADVSERIATRQDALRTGAQRNQLSIWNWRKQEALWIA